MLNQQMSTDSSLTNAELVVKEGKNKNLNRRAAAMGYLDVKYGETLLVDDEVMNGNVDNPNIGAHIFSGSIL